MPNVTLWRDSNASTTKSKTLIKQNLPNFFIARQALLLLLFNYVCGVIDVVNHLTALDSNPSLKLALTLCE